MLNRTFTEKTYQFHFAHLKSKSPEKLSKTKVKITSPKHQFKNGSFKLLQDQHQISMKHLTTQVGGSQRTNPQNQKLGSPSKRLVFKSNNKILKLSLRSSQKTQQCKSSAIESKNRKDQFQPIQSNLQDYNFSHQQLQTVSKKCKQSYKNKSHQLLQLNQINQITQIKQKISLLCNNQTKFTEWILLELQNIDKKISIQKLLNQNMKKQIEILKNQKQQLLKKKTIMINQENIIIKQKIKNDLDEQNKRFSSIKTQQTDSSFQKQLKSNNLQPIIHNYQEQYRKILQLFSIDITKDFHYQKLLQIINKMTLNIQKMSKQMIIYKQRDSQYYQFKKIYKQLQKQCNIIKKNNSTLHQDIMKYIRLTQELNQQIIKLQIKTLNNKYPKPNYI